MELNCENVVSGYYYKEHEWVRIPEEIRNEAWKYIVQFVAGSSHGARRRRILENVNHVGCIHNCGILSRLYFDTETKRVQYWAGQDYNYEMKILRDIFD